VERSRWRRTKRNNRRGRLKKLIDAGYYWTSGKSSGNTNYVKQLEWAGAPKAVIDSYLRKKEFVLFDVNLDAWDCLTTVGAADWKWREEHKGKNIYTKPQAIRSSELLAVAKALGYKNRGKILKKIRLIEIGVNGKNI
jgi:hypothetical protein